VGKGSCFRFTVCCDIAVDGLEGRGACPTVVIDTPVLVVDDNSTNRRILGEMLSNWGMVPTAVSGAQAGLQSLEDALEGGEPFRLVVSDVSMPDVDGFTFVESIRAHPKLAGLPVVMLTSGGRPGDGSRCEQLHISCSLLKPVKQSELLDAIVMAMGAGAVEKVVEELKKAELPELPPLRILLAEDNTINQKLVLGLLEPRGHHVTVARNGKEAVSAIFEEEFDVILMDVQMPVLDGFSATRMIREREKKGGKRVPIIAMTAHAMKGDRERCLKAGMDDYLAKPIRIGTVTSKLAEFFASELDHDDPAVPGHRDVTAALSEAGDPPGSQPAPVDWSHALENAGGDRALLRNLVEICLEDAPRQVDEVRAAIEVGDAAKVNCAAHALKGTLLVLGTALPGRYAQELESMAARQDLNRADEIYRSLASAMEPFREALLTYLDEN